MRKGALRIQTYLPVKARYRLPVLPEPLQRLSLGPVRRGAPRVQPQRLVGARYRLPVPLCLLSFCSDFPSASYAEASPGSGSAALSGMPLPRGAFWVPAAMPPCHDAQARPCQVARAACGLAEASRRHIMGPAGALRRPPPQIADIRSTWPHLHVASCKLWIFILSSGRGVHPQVLAPVPLRLAVPARCHPAASGRYCRRLAVELHVDR